MEAVEFDNPNNPHLAVLPLTLKEMDYNSAEIKSRNYGSLMEAMGQEKFRQFQEGQGLKSAPAEINEALQALSPREAKYSYAEYQVGGENKKQLFIEKTWDDGVRCVYVVDTEKSKPHVYKLDNLYTVGAEGKTVDLLEELDDKDKAYFTPIDFAGYDADSSTIVFGDLDRISQTLNIRSGIPVYVHEIGHKKDSKLNPELVSETVKLVRQKVTAVVMDLLQSDKRNIWDSKNKIVQKIIAKLGEAGKYILREENNATDYARVFLTRKRSQGVDLAPIHPMGSFAEQLHVALNTYELTYFGVKFLESVAPGYLGHREFIPDLTLLKVYKNLFSVIKENKSQLADKGEFLFT